jgi:hypothetical protein
LRLKCPSKQSILMRYGSLAESASAAKTDKKS